MFLKDMLNGLPSSVNLKKVFLNVETFSVVKYVNKGINVPQIFQPIHTMFSNIDGNKLSTLTGKLKLRLTELFH